MNLVIASQTCADDSIVGASPLVGSLKTIHIVSYHHGSTCLSSLLSEPQLDAKVMVAVKQHGLDSIDGLEVIDRNEHWSRIISKGYNQYDYGGFRVHLFTQKLDNGQCVVLYEAFLNLKIDAVIQRSNETTTRVDYHFYIYNTLISGTPTELLEDIDALNDHAAKLLVDLVDSYRKSTDEMFPMRLQ
ncbi:hypothetical protein [Vibrio sp. LaRot3]|uniref:hypothetical protein n=1 Tax=Vibrio sp. LaRot3 TaxID=2998829 RepID=UPI0022CDE248|nr:hypothetical protein [Vibrio sp. LaRot3]MDA0147786.1 hypothetical protein [Vibrio sp. LaRot3]